MKMKLINIGILLATIAGLVVAQTTYPNGGINPNPSSGTGAAGAGDVSTMGKVVNPDGSIDYTHTAGGVSEVLTIPAPLDVIHDVADYTELRATALATLQAEDVAQQALTVRKDGIAGTFVADLADTTTVDNGGTVIVAADGTRWKRVFNKEVSVRWFGALGDGVADDTAAFLAAVATRKSLIVPNGVYCLSSTLLIDTRGQAIRGESMTKSIIKFTADVDGISVVPNVDTEPNLPGSSASFNSWTTISDLAIYGVLGSTKKGWSNVSTPGSWQGEGVSVTNVYFQDWDTGFWFANGARTNGRKIVVKGCNTGIYFGDGGAASNNCHSWYGVSVIQCSIGMHLDKVRNGSFHLQDFADCNVGIKADTSTVSLYGGELETYTTTFLESSNSSIIFDGPRFLGSTTVIPIMASAKSTLDLRNCEVAQAGSTVVLAKLVDSGSIAFGTNNTLFKNSNFEVENASHVELYDGSRRMLSPHPWLEGTSRRTPNDNTRGALHWSSMALFNEQGVDDLRAYLKNSYGDNFVATAFKSNFYAREFAGTNANPQGYEDVLIMTNTGVRTMGLRATNHPNIKATSENMRVVTIVDGAGNAGTNNLTVNANGTDLINGQPSTVINTDYGSVTIMTAGDGKWFIKQ